MGKGALRTLSPMHFIVLYLIAYLFNKKRNFSVVATSKPVGHWAVDPAVASLVVVSFLAWHVAWGRGWHLCIQVAYGMETGTMTWIWWELSQRLFSRGRLYAGLDVSEVGNA